MIPKGVELPPRRAGFDLRRRAGLPRDAVVFLLPAGLREVKDPLFALDPLARLRRHNPRVAFVHVGETLEEPVGDALAARARGAGWICTLGAVPFGAMASAYAGATVVLNTSKSEGLANSIVEAQLASCAVLVSDIPANREVVRHGVTGLLYRAGNGESFYRAAARLVQDPILRRRLGATERLVALRLHSPRAEARSVKKALLQVVAS